MNKCYYSVAQSYPTLCDPKDCSMPGLSVPHHLPSLPKFMSIASVIHPAISSSDALFSFCPQSLPASEKWHEWYPLGNWIVDEGKQLFIKILQLMKKKLQN